MLMQDKSNIEEYLSLSTIIDFKNGCIDKLSYDIRNSSTNEIEYIKNAYELVRDQYPHSFDKGAVEVACSASSVIKYGHGICYAKSHLLAAILRHEGIPAGFCYQRLVFSEELPYLVLHALNAVYIESIKKWVRLDARGNKNGVNAQFSMDREVLAFSVNEELGEEDGMVVYAEPDKNVISALLKYSTTDELKVNLPQNLYYKMVD